MLSAVGDMLDRTCCQCVSGSKKVFNEYFKKESVTQRISLQFSEKNTGAFLVSKYYAK